MLCVLASVAVGLATIGSSTALADTSRVVGPSSPASRCTSLLNDALGSGNRPRTIKQRVTVADEDRIRTGISRLCAAADRDGFLNDEGDFDNTADFQQFIHANPGALLGVCAAIAVLAKASTPPAMARYLRPSDYTQFTRRLCKYAPSYLSTDGHIQEGPMMRAHPEILQRLCAAGFTAGAGAYDQNPRAFGSLSRDEFFRRSQGFCRDAFRVGVMTHHGGSDFRIHKTSAYRRLLRKYFSP